MLNRIIVQLILVVSISMLGYSNDLSNSYYFDTTLNVEYDYKKLLDNDLEKESFALALNNYHRFYQDSNLTTIEIIKIYDDYIQRLLFRGKYKLALSTLDTMALYLKKKSVNYPGIYEEMKGTILCFKGDFVKARPFLKKAVLKLDPETFPKHAGYTHYYLARSYNYQKDYKNALKFYKSSLGIMKMYRPNFANKTLRKMSVLYWYQQEYKKAYDCINQSLELIGYSPKKNLSTQIETIQDLRILGKSLQMRSFTARFVSKNSPDSIQYLTDAFNDALKSIEVQQHLKQKMSYESDMLSMNQISDYYYCKAVESAVWLYNATGDESIFWEAFKVVEMSKSAALLLKNQQKRALTFGGVPDSLVQYKKQLNIEISEFGEKLQTNFDNISRNTEENRRFSEKYLNLLKTARLLEKQLEETYPEYKKIKYQKLEPDIEFIKSLSNDYAILDYMVSDEKVYTFLVKDGELYFEQFLFPPHFVDELEGFHKQISDISTLDFSLKEQNKFAVQSHELYNQLIKPFENEIEGEKLLIVPDEQLSLVPFEVLLKTPADTARLNYSSLDYLIKHHPVTYTYSLSLLQHEKKATEEPMKQKMLAMAPGYKNLYGNKKPQYLAMRDARDELGLLVGAQKEVRAVGKQLKGELLTFESATEENFKNMAGAYNILHLAMHALVDNEHPMYSKLVFTPDADNREDGLLNTYELANLNLNAEMVVLSACNTGFGKLNKGEGIVGLSRGFIRAGCKSLVATLWSVSDKTSLDLMEGFYKKLSQGNVKSVSMAEAKRTYLSHAQGMYAHPFFWAGYVAIGNDEPVSVDKQLAGNKTWLVLLMTGVLVAITLLLWYRKSRR